MLKFRYRRYVATPEVIRTMIATVKPPTKREISSMLGNSKGPVNCLILLACVDQFSAKPATGSEYDTKYNIVINIEDIMADEDMSRSISSSRDNDYDTKAPESTTSSDAKLSFHVLTFNRAMLVPVTPLRQGWLVHVFEKFLNPVIRESHEARMEHDPQSMLVNNAPKEA
ncbi:hypothetical protein DPMN_186949 [Dreissena polymorpha]|uniref:Uncharacterized protein n=1 Tax=Dreissena polymorpha TaxID=45954 RepID=A0A9D4I9V4_DREPO|nr:hypothetical protein DPMN_186949 [Dreissena polymorpha]